MNGTLNIRIIIRWMYIPFVLILLVFPSGYSYSQNNDAQCIQLIRDIYKKTWDIPVLPEKHNQAYYLNYSVKTTLRDTLEPVVTVSNIELFIGKNISRLICDKIEVYQDNKYSVTVIKDKDLIYLSDPLMNEGVEQKHKSTTFLQDTLFGMCHVLYCDKTPNLAAYQEVVLGLNETAKNLFGIHDMMFFIDTCQHSITRAVINYMPTNKIAFIEVTINKVDYAYRLKELTEPVASLFFTKNEKLLPKYSTYHLIDTRIKSNE